MLINEAIKKVMKDKKVTQQMMAKALGKKRTSDIAARLSYSNMSVPSIIEMLEVLGYELVIQEVKSGKRREDQIVIEVSKCNTDT